MARLRDNRDAAAWRHAENDARRALLDSEGRFRTLADTMPQMVWSTLPDGYHDYYNARWYEFTGVPAGIDRWRGVERHVPPRRSGTRLGALAPVADQRRPVRDRIPPALPRRHVSLGARPRAADPRRRGQDRPLVRHLHRHPRAETDQRRARGDQPGAEPPHQEHLFGGVGARRVFRARKSRIWRDRRATCATASPRSAARTISSGRTARLRCRRTIRPASAGCSANCSFRIS